jgi:release factor glutamine methyltransferase
MLKDEYYKEIRARIEPLIQFLDDKPEETIDSTIKTLWLAATGHYVPAEDALKLELPELKNDEKEALNNLIKKRIDNVPLAYITGRQKFLGITFKTDKRALIPRKETEILGNTTLKIVKEIAASKKHIRVIDVCCGSGNLGLSIAKLMPETKVYLTDLSIEAVELTKENIEFLNLGNQAEVRQGDFLEAFESERFFSKIDLIVCNPPYISTSKVEKMPAEISFNEPFMAFDGGMMGIKIIQKLINESPRFLSGEGRIAFETGLGQGTFILQLLERSDNFTDVGSVNDAGGNIRAIFARNKLM